MVFSPQISTLAILFLVRQNTSQNFVKIISDVDYCYVFCCKRIDVEVRTRACLFACSEVSRENGIGPGMRTRGVCTERCSV